MVLQRGGLEALCSGEGLGLLENGVRGARQGAFGRVDAEADGVQCWDQRVREDLDAWQPSDEGNVISIC